MKFRTQVPPKSISNKISSNDTTVWVGSCFTENLGDYFYRAGMNALVNPFGTLFHPIPLLQNLLDVLQDKQLQEDLFWQKDGVWVYGMYHSKLAHENKETLISSIQSVRAEIKNQLAQAQHLFITLGTAWGYNYKDVQIVGNCHKQPAESFQKELANPNDIVLLFSELERELQAINPKLNYWLTVSPVKHLRDGISENTVSKGVCLYVCEMIQKEYERVNYIPAFELVQEDLRDYRFYTADMAHPNAQAVKYVWNYFSDNYLSAECKEAFALAEKVHQVKSHRPRNKEGQEWQQLQEKIKMLEEQLFKQFQLKIRA